MVASCLIEDLHIREGGVVGTLSALAANNSQEDLVVRQSEPGEVFRAEGPRHTCVQQGLSHLGLQDADFQTIREGRDVIQPRAELSEACPQ